MNVSEFAFDLPSELIAQEPSASRGESRLLLLPRTEGAATHMRIPALADLLQPGDLLVVNNTRVFPARLLGRRVPSGGAVECLLLDRVDGDTWEALVHPGQKLKPGAEIVFEGAAPLHAEILERHFFGRRLIRLWTDDRTPVDDAVDAIGHVPLPPYIHRPDVASDRQRYQTVFARARGSIAAPTAGLHFTDSLVQALGARGVEIVEITLHVGYGTFQPVRVDDLEQHRMERERYLVTETASARINQAIDERRRIVAVGTTTTRTLEAAAVAGGGLVNAGEGSTDLFIYPGFRFQVIAGLLTNFHLPKSSLLMLVAAFAGRDRVLAAYAEAIAAGYRFYSYGDAMLII